MRRLAWLKTIAGFALLTTFVSATGYQSIYIPGGGAQNQGTGTNTSSGVHLGQGAPSSGLGQNGDLYFDTLNLLIYGPKASGQWGSGFSMIGPRGAAGPAGAGGAGVQESPAGWVTPTGSINGSNAAFTLPSTPDPNTVVVEKNGVAMAPDGVDYTLSGGTITFVTASIPQAGDSLEASYWTNTGAIEGVQITPVAFAALPACQSGTAGLHRTISDSPTQSWGATVSAGGGASPAALYCDGTNWTVYAK